jgi:hypothetical protein
MNMSSRNRSNGPVEWDDRRVHALMPDESVIVRYERAGKWFREWPSEQMKPRQKLTVNAAATLARQEATNINFGVPGGAQFDRIAQQQTTVVRSTLAPEKSGGCSDCATERDLIIAQVMSLSELAYVDGPSPWNYGYKSAIQDVILALEKGPAK